MGAQDGITPLNAANVIHKDSDDFKYGNLVIYDGGVIGRSKGLCITNTGVNVNAVSSGTLVLMEDYFTGYGGKIVLPIYLEIAKTNGYVPEYYNLLIQFPVRIDGDYSATITQYFGSNVTYNIIFSSYAEIYKRLFIMRFTPLYTNQPMKFYGIATINL